jgi:hypothetical protein
VVAILCLRKPLKPTLRMVTSKATQVHAQCAICNVWLAIGVGVKSSADSKLDTHEVEQLCPAAGSQSPTMEHGNP